MKFLLSNVSTRFNSFFCALYKCHDRNIKPFISKIALFYSFLDYSSIQSIEYMSSSEEQEVLHSPNPFSTARRSKKYTSKKSYKEYLQSRPHSVNGSIKGCSLSATDVPGSDRNNNTIGKESISKSSSCGGAAKFSLIMNDIHGIRQQQKQQSCDDTHSLKINRMHGISLTTLNVTNESMAVKEKLVTINGEAANSGLSDGDRKEHNGNHLDDAATRKYCDEGMDVKQKIVTRDDWYISDIDENETMGIGKSPYGNVSGVSNSVLECVNQILLQQSMDEYIESNGNESKPKEASSRSNRRVHFSTKNSMVQIKSLPPPSDMHSSDDMLNSTYENQSTYSNEYELIGSSRTYVDMSDTRSVDSGFKPKLPPKPECLLKLQQIAKQRQFVQDQIFRKNSDYELAESEEPDYASISEIQDNIKSVKVVTAEIHHSEEDGEVVDNEYSEIKEVEEVPMTPTKIINYNNKLNSSSSAGEDSFADVPKLPNVYSIIPGIESPTSPSKKDLLSSPNNTNKCIGHDNYITKSPMKKKLPIAYAKKLAEISVNKKAPQSTTNHPPHPPPPTVPIKIIDEKLQQEFDWYNLDAEYTKSDIVITPQIENIEEMYQFDDENDAVNGNDTVVKVEYNLEDFEYETVPSSEGGSSGSGIEIETNNNNFTTVIKINESLPSPSETSPVKNSNSKARNTTNTLMELAETPKVDYKKNKIRYENFLKESGLISKPILTTRKKFCAGSFV